VNTNKKEKEKQAENQREYQSAFLILGGEGNLEKIRNDI